MAEQHAPGWYPDPSGRYEHRYYDGDRWTENVSNAGVASVDPEGIAPTRVVPGSDTPERVRRQVERQARVEPQAQGGGSIFDEPVLVVNQKAKLIELSNEYAVYDQHGNQIGSVRQVGQTLLRKILRFFSELDQYLKHELEVTDPSGRTLLRLTRPAKVFKSTVIVSDPVRGEIGRLVQQNMIGRIRFDLEAGGQKVGGLNAENWRAWDFQITDLAGTEVARVKKTWEGLAKAMFTTADNYVVRIHRPLEDPLRSLVVAAALTVDTALKQDSN